MILPPVGVSGDQAAGLLDKLNAILAKIAGGQIVPAINQLNAFINQVNAFMKSGLDAQAGQSLIDAANRAILMLSR